MTKCTNAPRALRKAIPEDVILRLWVRSGGRCAICNEVLYRSGLTLRVDNFADIAHIIASSTKGTRGNTDSEQLQIEYDNLMLLCKRDHKDVDGDESTWTVEKLRHQKLEHERRIEVLTSINRNLKTHALVIQSNIGENAIKVDPSEVNLAIVANKMYPSDEKPFLIDLTGDSGKGDENFYKQKAQQITKAVESFLQPMNGLSEKVHLSVFSLALMPLLVHLGKQLGDKYPIQLFQHHRTPASGWDWPDESSGIEFIVNKPEKRTETSEVFLKIALSDDISVDKHAAITGKNTNIYEITIENPTNTFLTDRNLIPKFHATYRLILNEIQSKFGKDCTINLLLAVPCPIAVQCGLSLLERKDPEIVVYDYDRSLGGFIKALKIT